MRKIVLASQEQHYALTKEVEDAKVAIVSSDTYFTLDMQESGGLVRNLIELRQCDQLYFQERLVEPFSIILRMSSWD